MKHALAPVAALLLGVAILLTGQGLQTTLIPIRASLEQFPTIGIGVMGGAYFLGFTVGCLRGGELVRRVGHVRVFLAMTALGSSAPLLNGLFVDVWVWIALRMIVGFCFAVLYLVIESWLNEATTNETRGAVFSIYVMISLTVMAAGQMMTLMQDPRQLQLFAMASVLVSLGALPVALSTSAAPQQPSRSRIDFRALWRISPAGVFGCLVSGLSNGAFWALSPVFVGAVTGDPRLAAWFMTAAVLGGAASQWPLGLLSDRIGRRAVLVGASLLGVAAGIALLALGDAASLAGVCALGALWGCAAFPLYTIAVAHSNDFARPEQFVMISSGLLFMYGAGAVVGPFIASAVMSLLGGSGLFLHTAVFHLAMVAFTLFRAARRETTPEAAHVDFVDAMAATHTKSRVYEREVQRAEEDAA